MSQRLNASYGSTGKLLSSAEVLTASTGVVKMLQPAATLSQKLSNKPGSGMLWRGMRRLAATGRMRGKLQEQWYASACSHTVRMLCRCPSVLGLSPERTVQPKLDRLVRLGVEPDDLRRVVLLVPQLLTLFLASIKAKVAAPPVRLCALCLRGKEPQLRYCHVSADVASCWLCPKFQACHRGSTWPQSA